MRGWGAGIQFCSGSGATLSNSFNLRFQGKCVTRVFFVGRRKRGIYWRWLWIETVTVENLLAMHASSQDVVGFLSGVLPTSSTILHLRLSFMMLLFTLSSFWGREGVLS